MTTLLSNEQRFPSKVDRWLLAIILIAFVVSATAFVGAVRNGAPFWLLLVLGATQVLLVWPVAQTSYVVTADVLIIRAGPFRWRVRLDAIQSLTATRNPLSSPALSLDRIAVKHTGGTVLVSPKDRAGFVKAILTANPSVATSGLPRPAGTGDGGDFVPKSTFSLLAIVPAIIISIAAAVLAATLIYGGTRPPRVAVSPRAVQISGLYSTTIARSDVVRIELVDTLPRPTNRSGFSAAGELRGDVTIDGLGRARVFISRDASPYIVFHTTTRPVVVNFKDPERTHALYDELRRTWQIAEP